jgi:hypothetical protein
MAASCAGLRDACLRSYAPATSAKRPLRCALARGFTDLLLNPVRLFSPPGPEAGQADIAAVKAGDVRIVSSWLRGSVDPYPRRLKQGSLYISTAETHWVPFGSLHRQNLPIDLKG